MAAGHAAGHLRWPSAMQFVHVCIAAGANFRPVCYPLTDTLRRLDAERRTVVPVHLLPSVIVIAAARGSAQLRVEVTESYEGVIHAFQR
jgi:hypothetical protein